MNRLVALPVSLCATLALTVATTATAAPFWTLQTVIEPPVLPDLPSSDLMGFGASVSVGNVVWLAVGAPKADCTLSPQGTTYADAGRVFLYKRVNGVWQYRQSICSEWPQANAAFGQSLEISQGWLMIGAPNTQVGNQAGAGQVSFYRYDAATDTWKWHTWFNGLSTAAGRLGTSVAMDRNLAIAGEPYYSGGRVRTWQLTPTTVTYEGAYAPGVFPAGTDYGRRLDVHANGCAQPACTSTPDTMAVTTDDKVYVAVRGASGWVASQTIVPAAGTSQPLGATVALSSRVLAISGYNDSSRGTGCGVGDVVRLVQRAQGATSFSGSLYACPPAGALATFGETLVVDRGTSIVMVGAPDAFALGSTPHDGGAVYTYDGTVLPQLLDTEYELGLAPGTGGLAGYDDAYGTALSMSGSHLAVGAPWSRLYAPAYGRGYVVIYTSCC